MALTQESILSFLLDHGGKVKNSDLLNHFRSRINCDDPAEKQHNRDTFKKLVNSVAVVKTLDEIKFVVAKKRYLDFIRDAPLCVSPQPRGEDTCSSLNTSCSYASPHRSQSVKATYSDSDNNNTCVLNLNNNNVCDNAAGGCAQRESLKLSRSVSCVDVTRVRVLSIPGHQASRAGKTGSVFAIVAVTSPPKAPAGFGEELSQKTTNDSTQSTLVTKVSPMKLPPPVHLPASKSDGALYEGIVQPRAGPPERPPPCKTSKQGEEPKYSESVPLDPLAHEWLVKCAAGLWGQVYALLLQDINLIRRQDFMSGFTVLHWAVKEGNCDIIRKIMSIARKRNVFMNVNCKAHGGYTPLHIAAIHGRTKVMFLLVQGYGANTNLRDNDGKKPVHYLDKNVTAEVKALLGAQPLSKYREKKDDEEYRKQFRNSMVKRFHPHKGKKHKVAQKYAQDW